jgi:Rrf2 family protein
MRFTAQEEYGLRCMVQMARREAKGPATIQEIAKAERLTPAYVGKLMRVLRQGGLVEATHGPTGGYQLTRPANEMSVGQVLEVLGGRLFEAKYCERYPGEQPFCVHTAACSIRSLWAGLDLVVGEILARTRLAELVHTERTMADWIRDRIPAAMEAAAKAAAAPALAPAGGSR